MKKTLLFTCLLLPILLSGQFGKEKLITQCTYCSFGEMDTADFDGDGDMDFISNFGPKNNVVWHENDGTGKFAAPQIIHEQSNGEKWAYDLNGDGAIDILTDSKKDSRLAWYQNDGQGNFSDPIFIHYRQYDYSAALAVNDLDNDGDIDLIRHSRRGQDITWYENDGHGNFLKRQKINKRYISIEVLLLEDLNGDDLLDIIYTSRRDSSIAWHQNLGEGMFSEEIIITEKEIQPAAINAFDIDKDGDIDLLFGNNTMQAHSPNSEGSTLFWYENKGNEVFSNKKIIDRIPSVSKIYSVNLDGKNGIDILVITPYNFFWYKNDGKGNFTVQEAFPAWRSYKRYLKFNNTSISLSDFDGDADTDILFIDEYVNGVVLYENIGNDNFSPNILYREALSHISNFEVEDLDNNQFKDNIITFSNTNNKIFEFVNTGKNTTFKSKTLISGVELIETIATSDLDKNGTLDIIWSSNKKDILWNQNDSSGNFLKQKIIRKPDLISDSSYSYHLAIPNKLSFFDLDGDEEEDILWRTSRNIWWSKNKGGGQSFTNERIIYIDDFSNNPSTTLSNFLTVDFDGDSNMDIVANTGNRIIWFKNDGTGNFNEDQVLLEDNQINDIKSIDINGDKRPEIIASTMNTPIIVISKDTEIDTFSTHLLPLSKNNVSYHLQTADLDKDGDMDIITTTNVTTPESAIYWLENDGLGNFVEHQIAFLKSPDLNDHNVFKRFNNIRIGDINRDGYLDIVASTSYNSKIVWFENLLYLPSISGKTFWDVNANGQFDEMDKGINYFPLSVHPTADAVYTNTKGEYHLYLKDDTYTVRTDSIECWKLTTEDSYTIPVHNNRSTDNNFGFQLVADNVDSKARVNSCATRCGFKTSFGLTIANTGCQPINGKVGVVLDSLVTFISANRASSEVRGDTMFWDYNQLLAGQTARIKLVLEIAGADHIGEIIRMTALSYIENEQGALVLANTFHYCSEIRCAYDPNDKITYPDRSFDYDQNYTLFEEELEYTIRFQNTGNDTAFTVVIKDQLDKNLDWTSFKPLTASHPHETLLHKDGLVEFSFRNILLPDSTTNEIESHGFVTFTISPKKGLPEKTVLQNTAGIYFDFNPPIITNTTSNVLVSELPKQLLSTPDIVAPQKVKVYPNPFGNYITFEQVDLSQTDAYTLLLFDGTGRQVKANQMKTVTHQLAVDDLVPGIFFYQVIHASGELIASGKVVKGE